MAVVPESGLFPEIESRDFIRSEDLEREAEAILHRHANRGHVGIPSLVTVAQAIDDGQLRVLYLGNVKPFDPLKEDVTHDAIAKAIKAPALWRDVTGYSAVIWCRSYFWGMFENRQKAAVALHELLHFDVEYDENGRAKLRIAKHDVEEFAQVVRYYGPLDDARRTLVKAFGQWEADAGNPSAPDGQVTEIAGRFVRDMFKGGDLNSMEVSTHIAGETRSVRIDKAMADRLAARIGTTKGARKPRP